MSVDRWTLIPEVVEIVSRVGGGRMLAIAKLRRWLIDEDLQLRADRAVQFCVPPPEPYREQFGPWHPDRARPLGPPNNPLDRPRLLKKVERNHILDADDCESLIRGFGGDHDTVWTTGDIATPEMNSAGERVSLSGLRLDLDELGSLLGPNVARVLSSPDDDAIEAPSEQKQASEAPATSAASSIRVRINDLEDWLKDTYTKETLPRVSSDVYQAARAHFASLGRQVTRDRVEDAVERVGWKRGQGRPESPEL